MKSLKKKGNLIILTKKLNSREGKMKEIESTGLDASSQQLKIAVLSAMNIADELFQSMDKNSEIITTIEAKGNSFIEYIDDRIKEIESQDKG